MDSMRESWTDKRLDDLNHRVDTGFERIDADLRGLRVETRTEFGALRGEMKSGFERVDERFERMDERFERMEHRMDERFERMDQRFDALHRLLIQFAGVLVAALIGLRFV